MNITKRMLAERVASETGITARDSLNILHSMMNAIVEALVNGNKVEFRKFGMFEVQVRRSRIGRNPKNPAAVVKIPERKVVRFRAGKVLKQRVRTEG